MDAAAAPSPPDAVGQEVPDWFVACILITWAVGLLLSTAVFVVLDGKPSRRHRDIVVLNPQVWCTCGWVCAGGGRACVVRLPATAPPAHDSPRGSCSGRPGRRRDAVVPVRCGSAAGSTGFQRGSRGAAASACASGRCAVARTASRPTAVRQATRRRCRRGAVRANSAGPEERAQAEWKRK